jgi:hypothetical protein
MKQALMSERKVKTGRVIQSRMRKCARREEIQNGELHRGKNAANNMVFPSQFARLLIEYQAHPEAKSLAPDGATCGPETRGLLKRAHIIAGEFRYVGKKQIANGKKARKLASWNLKQPNMRSKRVIGEIRKQNLEIGINKCARESGFDRKNFIRKLIRGIPVKRNSYTEFMRWLQAYRSKSALQTG